MGEEGGGYIKSQALQKYTHPHDGRPAVAVTTPSKKVAHEAGCAETKLAQELLPGLAQPRAVGSGRRRRGRANRAPRPNIVVISQGRRKKGGGGGEVVFLFLSWAWLLNQVAVTNVYRT